MTIGSLRIAFILFLVVLCIVLIVIGLASGTGSDGAYGPGLDAERAWHPGDAEKHGKMGIPDSGRDTLDMKNKTGRAADGEPLTNALGNPGMIGF